MSAGWLRADNRPKNALGEPAKQRKPVGAAVLKPRPRKVTNKDIERAERKYFSYEDIPITKFKKHGHPDPLWVLIRKAYSKALLTILYRGEH